MDVNFTPFSTGAKSSSLSIPANYPAITAAALSGTGVRHYTITVNKSGSTGTGSDTSSPPGIDRGTGCTTASAVYSEARQWR